MERFIGESHWKSAVSYLQRNTELQWAFVQGDPLPIREISKDGWDYIVQRHDNVIYCVTYHNGVPFRTRQSIYTYMDRIVPRYWESAIWYLEYHKDQQWAFVQGKPNAPLYEISNVGWDYVVHRRNSMMVCVTYYNGKSIYEQTFVPV